MEELMEQGGFASVAAQWVNSGLLLALYLLVARHADNRATYRAWLGTRVWMLAGVTTIVVWFYALPVLEPGLFAAIHAAEPVAIALYLLFKLAYWGALVLGIVRLQPGGGYGAKWWGLGACVMLLGLGALSFYPNLQATTLIQALVAVPALVFGLKRLRHLSKARANLGSKLMRGVLVLLAAVWVAYGVAFLGPVLQLYDKLGPSYSLFWLANAYVDTLLDSVLTFAMLVVLIEGTHERVERETHDRLRRIHTQQAQVVGLLKMPEIAAGDLLAVARAATLSAAESLGVDRVSVWMFGEDRAQLTCVTLYLRPSGTYTSGAILRSSELPIYFAALDQGTYIAASDVYSDPRTTELRQPYLSENQIGSMLDVKIRGTTEFLGVLCHEHIGGQRVWHDDEIAFAGFLADQLGQTLANHRAVEAERQRDELERQLRRSQKLEAVGQLAGGIAHDFNNMLCAIMGYASLAQIGTPADFQESLDQINSASLRAAELTRKLLSFSRRNILDRDVVEINDIVTDTVELVRRVVSVSIRIEVKLDPQVGRALVDRSELEQVLLNICNNACDAMPDGGCLTLQTRLEHLAGSEPGSRPGKVLATIRVSDTGTGISDEIRDRIFDPFFTTKPPGKGTGLGLATSYGIVKQLGGNIQVESAVGVGTTIEIQLPSVEAPATQRSVPSGEVVRGGNETILVVEDEEAVRKLMASVLERAGYRVLLAEDGAVALEVHSAHRAEIDAVLLDSVLPNVSGEAVYARIHELSPDLPVICTSGYLGQPWSSAYSEVLAKPFTRDALLAVVRSALDKGRLAR